MASAKLLMNTRLTFLVMDFTQQMYQRIVVNGTSVSSHHIIILPLTTIKQEEGWDL